MNGAAPVAGALLVGLAAGTSCLGFIARLVSAGGCAEPSEGCDNALLLPLARLRRGGAHRAAAPCPGLLRVAPGGLRPANPSRAVLPQKRVAEGASSRLKSVPRVQKQRWEVVCLLRGWKPLFSELCWPRCCCCAGSWVGMCALQLARSWLRRAGLMYHERASVHGGYWKMQLVALPSAKSKAGNEQHLPRVSARYGAAAGSWRKESSLQGCLRTAAGLVDKSSWEQNSGC